MRFHTQALGLTGREQSPSVDVLAIKSMDTLEHEAGTEIPASVREFFSFSEAIGLLGNALDSIQLVLPGLYNQRTLWYGRYFDFPSQKKLWVAAENQGVCNWIVDLNGTEDPPVLVEIDSQQSPKWLPYADTFSDFIFTLFWDYIPESPINLFAQDTELDQAAIRLLESSFEKTTPTYSWPGIRNHRFFDSDARILIWDNPGQADWHLRAQTPGAMQKALNLLSPLKTLRRSLFANDGPSENVLTEFIERQSHCT